VRRILLDTGPLVAYLDKRDPNHAWANNVIGAFAPPLYTCESVLSEASYVLGGRNSKALRAFLRADIVHTEAIFETHRDLVLDLGDKYADQEPDFADLCLFAMACQHEEHIVLTIDDADFSRFRTPQRRALRLWTPTQRLRD